MGLENTRADVHRQEKLYDNKSMMYSCIGSYIYSFGLFGAFCCSAGLRKRVELARSR